MRDRLTLNRIFYLIVLISTILGFVLVYLGGRIEYRDDLVNTGLIVILAAGIAFIGRNVFYMAESGDPDNLVTYKAPE